MNLLTTTEPGAIRRTRRAGALTVTTLAVGALAMVALADPIVLPNTFQNGTVADADEVNANFDELTNAVNDQDVRVGDLEGTALLLDTPIPTLTNALVTPAVVDLDDAQFVVDPSGTSRLETVQATTLQPIELRNAEGHRLSLGEAALHTVGYYISFGMALVQLVSVIFMLTSERGQSLTDMVMGTVMLNRRA